MRILLDTHTLFWWTYDSRRLSQEALQLIGDDTHEVGMSVVNLFELLQKQRAGSFKGYDFMGTLNHDQFTVQPLDEAALSTYASLPELAWRDPFDHLLMAQALSWDAHLCTADQNILAAPIMQGRLIKAN